MMVVTANNMGAGKSDEVTYEMRLAIRDGRPFVLGITSYPGLAAHDLAWQKQKDIEDQQKTGGSNAK